jgi:metacaspase-1
MAEQNSEDKSMTIGFPQGHALVIAIAAYRHISPLPTAVIDDARDIAGFLTSRDHCGYDPAKVSLLLDDLATRVQVLAGLAGLARRTAPDDTVCVYFSGHGAVSGGSTASDSILLTVDSDPADFPSSSINASELTDALQRIPAKRLVVFVDACHAGGAATLKSSGLGKELVSGFSDKALTRLAEGIGRALMASSRLAETSLILPSARNSVFTSCLLKGLGGAADRHGKGVIDVFDLFEYIAMEVPKETSGRQHPIFKASQLEQNFPIAISRKTKKGSTASMVSHKSGEVWTILKQVLPDLYPAGPSDQEVWRRSGGDPSILQLQGSGRATWFSALMALERGGGGAGITLESLLETVRSDYPKHQQLASIGAAP